MAKRQSLQLEPEALKVLQQFRLIFGAVRQHFGALESATGIGGAQVWALGVIAAQPGIGVSGLSAAMSVHQSTASNLVRNLVERGLVRTERDAADRRAVRLRLEPAGRAVLKRAPGPLAGVLPAALEQLPPQRLQALQKELSALLELIGSDRKSAKKPLAQM
jgi:DNA-binding MarR family transcriptional regulator